MTDISIRNDLVQEIGGSLVPIGGFYELLWMLFD
jgi:hypothetical protein